MDELCYWPKRAKVKENLFSNSILPKLQNFNGLKSLIGVKTISMPSISEIEWIPCHNYTDIEVFEWISEAISNGLGVSQYLY